MSHEIYLYVHCAAPNDIPSTFPDYTSLAEFTEKYPPRLSVGSMGEDVYEKLEGAVSALGLAPLAYFDFNKATEKIEESELGEIFIKRFGGIETREICDAIDEMIAKAIADPKSLVFEWSRFPDVNESEAQEIARCASEAPLDLKTDDLTYYDFGEAWDHFFYFLYVFREICKENSGTGDVMLLTWNIS